MRHTTDIRFHGRRKKENELFVKKSVSFDLDMVLYQGTRISEPTSTTEFEIKRVFQI